MSGSPLAVSSPRGLSSLGWGRRLPGQWGQQQQQQQQRFVASSKHWFLQSIVCFLIYKIGPAVPALQSTQHVGEGGMNPVGAGLRSELEPGVCGWEVKPGEEAEWKS